MDFKFNFFGSLAVARQLTCRPILVVSSSARHCEEPAAAGDEAISHVKNKNVCLRPISFFATEF